MFVSASEKQHGVVLRVGSGQPTVVWQNNELMNYFHTSVLVDGYLYGFHSLDHLSKNAFLKCVSFETGEVKWEQGGLGHGSLTVAGGRLLIIGEKGDLVVVDASPVAYHELARAKVLDGTCWTPPALCSGRIYCRNHRGDLLCLDAKAE